MSDQSAAPTPAPARHWIHTVVVSENGGAFSQEIDDHCADGYEVIGYSVAVSNGVPFHSALLRARTDSETHELIEQRRIRRLEEELGE